MFHVRIVSVVLAACFSVSAVAAAQWGLKEGNPDLKAAGPIAFGPDGILIVADVESLAVFAIDTGDATGDPESARINVADVKKRVADLLGVRPDDAEINDLAVNPASGNVYLSVTTGQGETSAPALVRIDGAGELSRVGLKNVPFSRAKLPVEAFESPKNRNPPITDLAYAEGKVLLAGSVPNPDGGRPLSTVREIPFPMTTADQGVEIEIYHGAHGRLENYAAVRTFIPLVIDGEPSLLAGFTCTPLVRFELESLKKAKRVRGTTVAELGNRNTPLDIIVYEKDGARYLLMANDRRGVMKINTDDIGRSEGIDEPVSRGGLAGQTYETIDELDGATQLDRLNEKFAIVVLKTERGEDLKTVALP